MGNEARLTFHTKEVMHSMEQTASKRMAEAVNVVRNTVLETLSGNRSGRTYKVPGTSRTYTASSPGKPPAQATGRLRQSIKTSVEGEGRKVIGKVGTTLDYGKYLEFGTRGGAVIRPRTAKVLAFFVDGRDVFATQVIQGPIAPRPWLKISFEKSREKVKSILSRKWF